MTAGLCRESLSARDRLLAFIQQLKYRSTLENYLGRSEIR